jgi:hypothetical protein
MPDKREYYCNVLLHEDWDQCSCIEYVRSSRKNYRSQHQEARRGVPPTSLGAAPRKRRYRRIMGNGAGVFPPMDLIQQGNYFVGMRKAKKSESRCTRCGATVEELRPSSHVAVLEQQG